MIVGRAIFIHVDPGEATPGGGITKEGGAITEALGVVERLTVEVAEVPRTLTPNARRGFAKLVEARVTTPGVETVLTSDYKIRNQMYSILIRLEMHSAQ